MTFMPPRRCWRVTFICERGTRSTASDPKNDRTRIEVDTLLQDLRYALRSFIRRPGFTAIAMLSLALAIGANSLIYGLVDGFVLRPFPYPEPDRLISVGVTRPKI